MPHDADVPDDDSNDIDLPNVPPLSEKEKADMLRAFERAGEVPPTGVYDPFDLLPTARDVFAEFYAAATPADRDLLDALVMTHGALVIGLNVPRAELHGPVRTEVEKATNAAEQAFASLQERVRGCPTFAAISEDERRRLERFALTVRLPLDPRE